MKYIMKYNILFLLFFLTSCATISNAMTEKTKYGNICWNEQNFQVLQGLEYGALAYECPRYDDRCWGNKVVYLVNTTGDDFYDKQNVSSSKEQCWVQEGVYRYTTNQNIQKAVPFLILEDK